MKCVRKGEGVFFRAASSKFEDRTADLKIVPLYGRFEDRWPSLRSDKGAQPFCRTEFVKDEWKAERFCTGYSKWSMKARKRPVDHELRRVKEDLAAVRVSLGIVSHIFFDESHVRIISMCTMLEYPR